MLPLRIKIEGNFWDSQIYRGRLYLWNIENELHIFNWDAFVEHIAQTTGNHFLIWAFSRGNELYQDFLSGPLFKCQDILKIVKEKFNSLAGLNLNFKLCDIEQFRMGIQQSPFNELHDDLTIIHNTAYALNEDGFFSASIHKPKRNKYLVDKKSKKLWDGRGVNVAASKGYIAIAAASDGLFEYTSWLSGEPKQISINHVSFANWLFASIYASSKISNGYLAAYNWNEEELSIDRNNSCKRKWVRAFSSFFDEQIIFRDSFEKKTNELTWGGQEKIYKAGPDKIKAIRFTQKYITAEAEDIKPFEEIGEISINNNSVEKSEPLSAGVSFFGSVVEYPNHIIILESDTTCHPIKGSVTRWRIFPRSHWYLNHLHIIQQDYIDILSLNGDLFADQREKLSGIEYRKNIIFDS